MELSVAFQTDKSPEDYRALGRLVASFGFGVVSVYNDLFFQPALGPLLYLAQEVRGARLGPAALNPYTLHPVEIAGQIAVLDAATGGRAYLGLARGSWLDTIGVDVDRPITRLRETVDLVHYLLRGDTRGYRGDVFSVARGYRLQYEPVRDSVPITLGTWGERTARTIGPLVEEMKIGGSASPRMVKRMHEWVETNVCVGAVTVVDNDRTAARALARRQMALYVSVVAALDVTLDDPEWVARIRAHGQDYASVARDISDSQLDLFAFAGAPADIVRQVEELCAAGATRVEFGTPHGLDAQTGIRLLGQQVLPAFS